MVDDMAIDSEQERIEVALESSGDQIDGSDDDSSEEVEQTSDADGLEAAIRTRSNGKRRRRDVHQDEEEESNTAEVEDGNESPDLMDPTVRSKKKKSKRSKNGGKKRRRDLDNILDDDELAPSTVDARERELKRQKEGYAVVDVEDEEMSTSRDESDGEARKKKEKPKANKICLNLRRDGEVPENPVYVSSEVADKLKPHQVKGARFLWSHIGVEGEGFGCVLADFMGLGKTLQVITVVQAFMAQKTEPEEKLSDESHSPFYRIDMPKRRKVLILAPTICVRNWEAEVVKWLGKKRTKQMRVATLESSREKKMKDRIDAVRNWYRGGGLLIMGYELFRLLVLQGSGDEKIAAGNAKHKKEIEAVKKHLSSPDLIVLDEGHRVRDRKSKLVKALAYVETTRRIILTGYPLQNHLEEYWTMVNFARPDYLGNLEEFKNRFIDPIKNSQCTDSSATDIKLARQRAYVLTQELKPLVLRRDQQFLFRQLPPKKEYVLLCKLTNAQAQLYRTFLTDGVPKRRGLMPGMDGKIDVLVGYHISLSIANHPDVLAQTFRQLQQVAKNKDPAGFLQRQAFNDASYGSNQVSKESSGVDELDMFLPEQPAASGGRRVVTDSSDNDSEIEILDDMSGAEANTLYQPAHASAVLSKLHRLSFAEKFLETYKANQVEASGKFMILMDLLRECKKANDRVILFSQSIPTLNTVELMLEENNKHNLPIKHVRIDGSTPQSERFQLIEHFNNLSANVDLILISTKAGGEGVNLCAGNRIIIFDVCWNPCNDSQSMCRSYRFGQTKPVFVYRFVSAGTMEKKVYDLQIQKEGVAKRVVDDKAMERKFKQADLANYFNVKDFEASLSHKSWNGHDEAAKGPPKEDDVLSSVMNRMKDEGNDMILDWFEQETMFEEDLDAKCTEDEGKMVYEGFKYQQAIQRMKKKGTVRIDGGSVRYVNCTTCHQYIELYPETATKLKVPSVVECGSCGHMSQTQGARAASEMPRAQPYRMGGAVPPYMPYSSAHPGMHTEDREAERAEYMRRLLEQARAEQHRQAMLQAMRSRIQTNGGLKHRCILVLRKGLKGCQQLKKEAEEMGATLAIEIGPQVTDIVSAMSEEETLARMKIDAIPSGVTLRSADWLKEQLETEKRDAVTKTQEPRQAAPPPNEMIELLDSGEEDADVIELD